MPVAAKTVWCVAWYPYNESIIKMTLEGEILLTTQSTILLQIFSQVMIYS